MLELIYQKYKEWDQAIFFRWCNSVTLRETQKFRWLVEDICLRGYEESLDVEATAKYGQVVFVKK